MSQTGFRKCCPGSIKSIAVTRLASKTSSLFSQSKLLVRSKINPDKKKWQNYLYFFYALFLFFTFVIFYILFLF